MKQRFKYRFYPNAVQREALARQFGCCRVVYNDAIASCRGRKYPGRFVLQKELSERKQTEERSWLREVSSAALQAVIRQADWAMQNLFQKRGKYPRFKKRSQRQSATFNRCSSSLKPAGGVYLAKIGIVYPIWSRPLPSEYTLVTVIKDCADRYFLSFLVEIDPIQFPAQEPSLGIDLGIKTFATLSTGEKIQAPDYSQLDRRIRRLQKGLARRQKGSKRRNKRRLAIARTYNRIADLRLDFLHKLSTQLAQIYQAIVLENLNVSGMLKNRRLARAIAQQGWSIFKALLEFKAAKYLRELQVISRWEPTSQICSDCGYRWGKLDLSVRRLKCLSCGAIQDRDINAAKNIVAVGLGHRKTQNRTWSGCKTTFGGNLRESV